MGTHVGARTKYADECKLIRLNAKPKHTPKHLDGLLLKIISNKPIKHRIPHDNVLFTGEVKHAHRLTDAAAFRIKVDQRASHKNICIQAMPYRCRM
jgi:hypothetical protein